jgi:Tol biopolymer transport system component
MIVRARLLPGMLLTAIVVLALAGVADAAFPGRNGRIAFMDTASSQLYAVNPDGSGLDRLTSLDTQNGFPSWSPDSRHIVFTRFQAPQPRIWSMRADGSHKRKLPGESARFGDYVPKYTPDGKHIVFSRCSDEPEGCTIWRMRTNGSHRHGLTRLHGPDNITFDINATVAPNGKHIAFGRGDGGGYRSRVFVMDADGRHAHPITKPALQAGTPDWAPVGGRLVFNSQDVNIGGRLFTARPDGSDLEPVTADLYPFASGVLGAWAPRGNRLVYSSDRNYADACCLDLFKIDPAGTNDQQIDLGPDPPIAGFASWGSAPLADGAKVAAAGATGSGRGPIAASLHPWR